MVQLVPFLTGAPQALLRTKPILKIKYLKLPAPALPQAWPHHAEVGGDGHWAPGQGSCSSPELLQPELA